MTPNSYFSHNSQNLQNVRNDHDFFIQTKIIYFVFYRLRLLRYFEFFTNIHIFFHFTVCFREKKKTKRQKSLPSFKNDRSQILKATSRKNQSFSIDCTEQTSNFAQQGCHRSRRDMQYDEEVTFLGRQRYFWFGSSLSVHIFGTTRKHAVLTQTIHNTAVFCPFRRLDPLALEISAKI